MCGLSCVPTWSPPWLYTKQNPAKFLSNSPINFPCTCTSLTFSATAIVPFFCDHWLQPLSVYRSHDHARPNNIFIDSKQDRRREKVGSQSPVSIPPCKRKRMSSWNETLATTNQIKIRILPSKVWLHSILLPFQRATAKCYIYVDLEIENLDKIQVLKQSYSHFKFVPRIISDDFNG